MFDTLERFPGLDLATTTADKLLNWGARNSMWIFPMATSCCGIEFMASAASRVDFDRMGSFTRATPRQSDVMVVAGTITVKMAPRVKRLWDQMPEPKWCVAMGSCAISGDFYRDIYSVIPGIDTVIPVDVYVPGCPPNPEALMAGLMRLQELIALKKAGLKPTPEDRPEAPKMINPRIRRLGDPGRLPAIDAAQVAQALSLDLTEPPDLLAAFAAAKAAAEAEAAAEAQGAGAQPAKSEGEA
ncbi:MAG: NADH-quinone oxidoreductase subunit NuoB [Myxococcales bacterium]|nr:NADH-quinone oxidoreductase subunit NuoB [Myxococcales bacterium]